MTRKQQRRLITTRPTKGNPARRGAKAWTICALSVIRNKKRRNIRIKQVKQAFAKSRAAMIRPMLGWTSTVRAIFMPEGVAA